MIVIKGLYALPTKLSNIGLLNDIYEIKALFGVFFFVLLKQRLETAIHCYLKQTSTCFLMPIGCTMLLEEQEIQASLISVFI